MDKRKKTLGVILLLVIYVVIALVGFLGIYFLKTFIDNSSSERKDAKKTSSLDSAKGVHTYRDEKNKFSFDYHSDLAVTESAYDISVKTLEFNNVKKTDETSNFQVLILPKNVTKTLGQDFSTYYALPNNTTKTITSPIPSGASEAFTKLRTREINKLRAFDYTAIPSPKGNQTQEVGTTIEAGDTVIIFSTSEANRKTLEAMLKTFAYPI